MILPILVLATTVVGVEDEISLSHAEVGQVVMEGNDTIPPPYPRSFPRQ